METQVRGKGTQSNICIQFDLPLRWYATRDERGGGTVNGDLKSDSVCVCLCMCLSLNLSVSPLVSLSACLAFFLSACMYVRLTG